MNKLFCKKHRAHNDMYIVCSHVARDGAEPTEHVDSIKDVDRIGQVLCAKNHWPLEPGNKGPVVMCRLCALDILNARRAKT